MLDRSDLTQTIAWYRAISDEHVAAAHEGVQQLLAEYARCRESARSQSGAIIDVLQIEHARPAGSRNSQVISQLLIQAQRLESAYSEADQVIADLQQDASWLEMAIRVPVNVLVAHSDKYCLVCGEPGTGHSWQGLWLRYRGAGEQTDPAAWIRICRYCSEDSEADESARGFLLRPEAKPGESPVRGEEGPWFLIQQDGSLKELAIQGRYDETGNWMTQLIDQAADSAKEGEL